MIVQNCNTFPFRDGRPVGHFEGNILVIIKDRYPQHIGSIIRSALSDGVVAQLVGIIGKLHGIDDLIRFGIEDFAGAVAFRNYDAVQAGKGTPPFAA